MSDRVRLSVLVVVDIDPDAWETEYGTSGDDAVNQMAGDAETSVRIAFLRPEWEHVASVDYVLVNRNV